MELYRQVKLELFNILNRALYCDFAWTVCEIVTSLNCSAKNRNYSFFTTAFPNAG